MNDNPLLRHLKELCLFLYNAGIDTCLSVDWLLGIRGEPRATLKSDLDVFVDFLFANDDFQKEALSRRQSINMADFTVNIPTPEDLILLKLISGREQDLLDAKKVFIMQKAHLEMKYIQIWLEKLQVKLPFA